MPVLSVPFAVGMAVAIAVGEDQVPDFAEKLAGKRGGGVGS